MPNFNYTKLSFYYHKEEQQGIPFIFLHDIGANSKEVVTLLGNLPNTQLLTFDFRGHGRTLANEEYATYSIEQFAIDTIALLDFLKIEKAIIGGVSLGAAVALHLALNQPNRVEGLVLVRPSWLDIPNPPNLENFQFIGQLIELYGLKKGIDIWQTSMQFQRTRAQSVGAVNVLTNQFRRPQAGITYKLLQTLPQSIPFQSIEQLYQIDMPVLVIGNHHDPLHPLAYSIILAEKIPHAILKVIPPRYLEPESYSESIRMSIEQFIEAFF